MALTSPFDLKQILIVDLAGSPEIFSFLAIILVGWMMSKFTFNNTESIALFVLFGVLMSTFVPVIYVLLILIVAFTVYYQISKFAR